MAISLGDLLVVGVSGALNLLMPMGRLYTISVVVDFNSGIKARYNSF
jgi:hypothetical protein